MGTLEKFTHLHNYTVVVLLLLLVILHVTKTVSAERKTKTTSLWKQGPFNVTRLFQIVFDTFLELTNQSYRDSVVVCSNFTSRFQLRNQNDVFNETLSFYNVTFHSLSSVRRIHNVTVSVASDGAAVTDAWISCRDVFVRFCHAVRFDYFLSDIAVCNVVEPYARVTINYYLLSNRVELVWARFGRMAQLDRLYYIPIRCDYEKFTEQMGDMLLDRFLYFDKSRVDDELYDRFNTAIQLSGITHVLNITLNP